MNVTVLTVFTIYKKYCKNHYFVNYIHLNIKKINGEIKTSTKVRVLNRRMAAAGHVWMAESTEVVGRSSVGYLMALVVSEVKIV